MVLFGGRKRRVIQKHLRGTSRKSIALLLAALMLCSMLPATVFALGNTPEYLCGHVHDTSCGYIEGSEGTPCTHAHDANCGYVEGSPCSAVHIHDENCGYCEVAPCAYVHTHNESCGYVEAALCTYSHTHDENCGYCEGSACTDVHAHDESCGYAESSLCTDAHVHDEDCGYIAAAPCAYSHTHDENCGYIQAVACNHVHDASCGYSAPVPATPCSHICEILSFNDFTPGVAVSTYEAESGDTFDDISAALPETLPGKLACAAGDVDIPLRWSCADYSEEPRTYTFRAELENEHCTYAVADDELTEDVDEGVLPFIAVTVPETAAPAPTTAPANNTYTISDDTNTVSVTGPMPEGAYLVVEEVAIETAQDLLGESEAVVIFAYDIRIMLPGALDEATGEYGAPTEYQPGADCPVTVTITPPEPIEAPTVEVIHIAEDESGEPTPQPVQNVTTTENSVEFKAEGFSVYVVTMGTNTPRVTFSYDDASLGVEYCTTRNGTYELLNGNVSVAAGTALYFKVSGGSIARVYRDGTTAMTDDGGVYTINSITANTIITIGAAVTLNVEYGNIVIGDDDGIGGRKYTYSDSSGEKSGTHYSSNIYTITGETGTSSNGGGYNVSLIGEGDFNVVLSGVTIYTGEQGGSNIGKGICAPVSTSGVTGAGDINITLVEINRLENVSSNPSDSYAALEKISNDSTLIINGSGTLYAIGGADSAGIGSSDKMGGGTKNITINGGTIHASTRASQGAGIGSGNNAPAVNIRIYGGNITATGVENGAGIGGSGSATFTAETGEVYIYGGTIIATSNGKGAGIGGGGSGTGVEATGGAGEVHIYGGTITAGSIGGGDGGQFGGNATVNISGGRVTVTGDGNIGGGSSSEASGGSATVTISGGTVATPHISGGKNYDGTYNDATLSIAAASVNIDNKSNINSVTGPDPDSGMDSVVYCQTIDIRYFEGFTGTVSNCHIDSASLTDGHTYLLNDVYTDTSGLLYFWLPTQYSVTELIIDDVSYSVAGALVQVATITHSSSTVGSVLGAALNHGTPTAYQWQRSVTGTEDAADWSDITGASAQSYITTNDDLDKYVRVMITDGSDTITSGSLRITNTPHASITYTSLEAPTTLTAQLLNGSDGTYSYQWQMYNTTTENYDTLSGATEQTIQIEDYSYIGKRVRVIITDGQTTYTTAFVFISPPTLNVTVPLDTVVTVDAAGNCTVAGGAITNNSAVPVYVTGVDFNWQTSGDSDANELFNDYAEVTATLTLNETEYSFSGADPTAASPTAVSGRVAAKSADTAGTLALSWDFSLGTGNYLKLAPTADSSVQVATITYTVDYLPPTTP